jgi:hypothetical protein
LGLPIGWIAPAIPAAGVVQTGRRAAARPQNPFTIG